MSRLRSLAVSGILALLVATPTATVIAQTPPAEADLGALKAYLTEHSAALNEGAIELQAWSQSYYDAAEATGFDYQALWDANAATLPAEIEAARLLWTEKAHGNYELSEGLVAGIPSLAEFDVWLDAGLSDAEDPANAYVWDLELPDGVVFTNPGNIFHNLSEPTLWGTDDAFVGLAVDLNDDGQMTVGDALPNANILLGVVHAMVDASGQLQEAIADWEPSLSDAFTALVVMIPTAQGYVEQWKLSPFVLGAASTQSQFVANSRLLDVIGIYGGLQLTYDNVRAVIDAEDPAIAEQIQTELDGIAALVQDLFDQETAGTRFTPEQADQYGTEIGSRADLLAGQITQAAALLDIEIQEVG